MSEHRFISDSQTIEDLALVKRFRKDGVLPIFDRTVTRKASARLEEMFRTPLADAAEINRRRAAFDYFRKAGTSFPFDAGQIEDASGFIGPSAIGFLPAVLENIGLKIKGIIYGGDIQDSLRRARLAVYSLAAKMLEFLKGLPPEDCPFAELRSRLLKELPEMATPRKSSLGDDILLRHDKGDVLAEMLSLIYDIDLYTAVAAVAEERGFCSAEAVDGVDVLDIQGVYHPALEHPVGNDLHMDASSNMLFLTGVNMAGKSTFMKSVSIAVYLAHAGFPVPAKSMRFKPMDGLFTSINVSDSIALSLSHFYAEVQRVKAVAQKVASGGRYFVAFDELFKGTNVKDAYDATLEVTAAFAGFKSCRYIISTHITEVGEALQEQCPGVLFRRLCSSSSGPGAVPVYTYRLEDGISTERHGMDIIRAEHILEILGGDIDR